MNYNYLILDASYFLRRNFMVVRRMEGMTYANLIDSFLTSVFKLRREYCPSGSLSLLWDKQPYICSERIKQYKKDREYVTTIDVEKAKEKVSKEKDEAKRKILEEDVARLERLAQEEAIYIHAKASLSKCLKNTLFNTIQVQGYEADNLAYLLSQRVPKGKKALLASVDSDWIYFVNEHTDYLRVRSKGRRDLYTTEKPFTELVECKDLGIPLHHLGIFKELYYGGHNNVPAYCETESHLDFPEFCKALFNKQNFDNDETLTEYQNFYGALDIDTADNTEIEKELEQALSDKSFKNEDERVKSYFEFLKINPKHYDSYLSLRNRISLDSIMESFEL